MPGRTDNPLFHRRSAAAAILCAALALGACAGTRPLGTLAQPEAPSAEELAADFKEQNILGVDEQAMYPSPEDPVALVSCAVAFRPESELDGANVLAAIEVASELLPTETQRAITDAFCSAFTEALYAEVPLNWMPEEEVFTALEGASNQDILSQGSAYAGYGYFGGVWSSMPALNGDLRETARELDRMVFLAGLDVTVESRNDLVINSVHFAGYTPDGRMRNGADFLISRRGNSYTFSPDRLEGIDVLAEALALKARNLLTAPAAE